MCITHCFIKNIDCFNCILLEINNNHITFSLLQKVGIFHYETFYLKFYPVLHFIMFTVKPEKTKPTFK